MKKNNEEENIIEQMTWSMLDEFIRQATIFFKEKKFTGIYGIPRGGLIAAVMLSHSLNVPLVLSPTKGCLIVDDISDSGETLKPFVDEGYTTTTIYYKKGTIAIPTFSLYEKKDKWIIYPWEPKK